MIRAIIQIAVLVLIGILVYNYFLGTPDEKEHSEQIVSEIKDVGYAIGNLLKTEKSKFDEGKYDDAFQKIGDIFDDLRSRLKGSVEWSDRLRELELKKSDLQKRIEELGNKADNAAERERLKMEMENLMKETEDLARDIERTED